ncbi:MAG: hypothetical protein LC676_10650 [Loktanella sp.]|nr:hypothetical protein [Loktanella sp.]
MTTEVTTLRHTLGISDVAHVDVTEIVAEGGGYVREVRVYGSPDGTGAPPVAVLRISAPTEAALGVQTPELTF